MAGSQPVYLTVSALDAGHLTLPEHLFVTQAEPGKRTTVPSLSFLIQRPVSSAKGLSRLVFDLGVKRDLAGYADAQQYHITQRQPTISSPDCADSLRAGGLDSVTDIDNVIISHVHWDHVGTPSDFTKANFNVGAGTLEVLKNGAGYLYPGEMFNDDELPADRTYEFPPTPLAHLDVKPAPPERQTRHSWTKINGFPAALDFYGDGSLWVIDTPGHLIGHVNLLTRIGDKKWVYLGGDCCHDPRILRGERGIAMYEDGRGGARSVHWNTEIASQTLDSIRSFLQERRLEGIEDGEIEITAVISHDKAWAEENRDKFFPGHL